MIRRVPREVVPSGIPRTRPAVAAIRAAHWAVINRQAALVLAMPVQQRIVSPAQLREAALAVRGRTRRAFIKQVVDDIADGAHSLGELDFAAMCRVRGLPEPSRQVVRRGPRGRVYLDAGWEDLGLAVEIDGAGHRAGLAVTDDLLRQNAVTIGGELVLRVDLLGLRIEGDAFMDQVCRAHRDRARRRSRRRSPPRFGVFASAIASGNTPNREAGQVVRTASTKRWAGASSRRWRAKNRSAAVAPDHLRGSSSGARPGSR